jgi:hypothetical protein
VHATSRKGSLPPCSRSDQLSHGDTFAITDLAGAIGTLVTQALDNLVGIAKRFAEALSKVRDIMSMMSDGSFPERVWPQAVNG